MYVDRIKIRIKKFKKYINIKCYISLIDQDSFSRLQRVDDQFRNFGIGFFPIEAVQSQILKIKLVVKPINVYFKTNKC